MSDTPILTTIPPTAVSSGRQTLKNTVFNGVRLCFLFLSTVITSVLVARALGPDKMGVYSYGLWLASIFGIFASLGIPTTLTKFISEYLGRNEGERARAMARHFLIAQILMATVTTGVAALMCFIAIHSNRRALLVAVLIVFPQSIEESLEGALAGQQKYDRIAAIVSLGSVVQIIAVCLAAWMRGSILSMLLATLGASLFRTLLAGAVLRKSEIWSRRSQPRSELKPTLKVAYSFAFTSFYILILNMVVWQRSEVLFLKRYSTLSDIAIYTIAFSIAGKLSEIGSAFTNTLMPVFSETFGQQRLAALRSRYEQAIRYVQMTIVLFCAIGMIGAGAAVRVLYGDSYSSITPVLQILLATVAFTCIGGIGSSMLYAVHRQGFIARFGTLIAALNLLLDYFLIPHFGAVGAAFANGISQVAAVWGGIAYAGRILEIGFPWRSTLTVYCSISITMFPILYFAKHWHFSLTNLIFSTFAATAAYLLILYVSNEFGPSEISRFRTLWQSRFRPEPA